ncbi:MAG: hypothetical protein NZ761_09075 [Dehalococcoidia bacterium]|nr:hypothetical protein [Dehalococcoidia bacterium]
MSATRAAVHATIAHAWNLGVPIVAYVPEPSRLLFLLPGGVVAEVAWDAVADPPRVARQLAAAFSNGGRPFETELQPDRVPELSARTFAWWRFLRVTVQRERAHWPELTRCPATTRFS